MGLILQIIQGHDFIRTSPTGELNWEETKAMFNATAAAAKGLNKFAILIDLRKVETVNLTTAEVWELADRLIQYGSVFANKTALLLPDDGLGDHARFFELCARNRGFQVSVFQDFEQAICWLATPMTEVRT